MSLFYKLALSFFSIFPQEQPFPGGDFELCDDNSMDYQFLTLYPDGVAAYSYGRVAVDVVKAGNDNIKIGTWKQEGATVILDLEDKKEMFDSSYHLRGDTVLWYLVPDHLISGWDSSALAIRENAIEEVIDDWDESFNKLPDSLQSVVLRDEIRGKVRSNEHYEGLLVYAGPIDPKTKLREPGKRRK